MQLRGSQTRRNFEEGVVVGGSHRWHLSICRQRLQLLLVWLLHMATVSQEASEFSHAGPRLCELHFNSGSAQVRFASNFLQAARQLEVLATPELIGVVTERPSPVVGLSFTYSLEARLVLRHTMTACRKPSARLDDCTV